MKSTKLFIFICIVIASLHAQSYTLPDLGVNTTPADCSNANDLLPIAHNDQTRLQGIVNKIATNRVFLEEVAQLVDTACNHINALNPVSFAQMPSGTSFHSKTKKAMKKLKKLTRVKSEFEKDLNKRMDKAFDVLSQISQATIDELKAVCGQVQNAVTDLDNYLVWASNEIQQQYLNTYLPQRIDTLTDLINNQCNVPEPDITYVKTGILSKVYPAGHTLTTGENRTRYESHIVYFDVPFIEIPEIALSITGWDISSDLYSIALSITDITEEYFSFRIAAIGLVKLYAAQVHWMAFLGTYTQIHYYPSFIDYTLTPALKTNYNKPGYRSYTRWESHVEAYSTPAIAIGITGFSFATNTGAGARFSITAEVEDSGATVKFETWGDTILYSVVAAIISYEASPFGVKVGVGHTESSINGPLATGSGLRFEDKIAHYPFDFGFTPLWFPLINYVEATPSRGLFNQTAISTNDLAHVRYSVDQTLKIAQVKSTVFATCTNNLNCYNQ